MSRELAAHLKARAEAGALEEVIEAAQAALASLHGEDAGHVYLVLAQACASNGRYLDSLRAAVAASDGFRNAGDSGGICDALTQVGTTLRGAGDHATAISTLEQAESLARLNGDDRRRAAVLRQIGICCSIIGRHRQAQSYLSEVLELYEGLGDINERLHARLSYYNSHNRQAVAHPPGSAERLQGLQELPELWLALAGDARDAGQTRLALMAHGNYAITLREAGRPAEGAVELEALRPRYRDAGMRPNEAICRVELGRCCQELGQLTVARDHFLAALELLQANGSLDDLHDALEGLSLVQEALGDHRGALAALREDQRVLARKTDAAAHSAAVQRELRIELARLTHEWAVEATRDPLTGLANRRGLERWIAERLPRVELGEPLTLLLMDLDHFKRINDRYGHGIGDEVLRQVARLLQSTCRARDLAARYGGEEFILGLASTDPDGALATAHRLRESIEKHAWDTVSEGLRVSTSIGVAHAAETADAQALLTLADRRLYAAKYAGRNQVVAAG